MVRLYINTGMIFIRIMKRGGRGGRRKGWGLERGEGGMEGTSPSSNQDIPDPPL